MTKFPRSLWMLACFLSTGFLAHPLSAGEQDDPQFENSASLLSSGDPLSSGQNLTQSWIQKQLSNIFPGLNNTMAQAALNTATGEMASGVVHAGTMPVKDTILRSGLEGLKAAATLSDMMMLNRLEVEYSLSEGGLDEYSLLTIQPLYSTQDERHSVFAQGSYANKSGRDTANLGVAYRYITPDDQHMFGVNTFLDHQWPYHHGRMSIGLDYETSLIGAHLNHYVGTSGWRAREDGAEEKALGGTDLELSGRLPQRPELELFIKGFHWDQDQTATGNPDGDDIWGYAVSTEYTPVNFVTLRGSMAKDNAADGFDGTATVRLNYRFGQGFDDLWARPSYNLDSVRDRRFDKVRRTNEIRVQVNQAPAIAAAATILGLAVCPAGDLSAPANAGCARLFGADATNTDDVVVYAGDVPGTATDFFVRRCDLGQTYDPVDARCEDGGGSPTLRSLLQWKTVNSDSPTANIPAGTVRTDDAARNGPNNTALLVAGPGTHPAAVACNALPGGGWYLPGISEIDVIYANLVGTDDPDHPLATVADAAGANNSGTTGPLRDSFNVGGTQYWSSSEVNNLFAWRQRMNDGVQSTSGKTVANPARCARR